MSKIFIYSIPKKIGPTQHERLGQRIAELKYNDKMKYQVILYDGDNEIGYIEPITQVTDDYRKILKFLFDEYNVKIFDSIETFYGACFINYIECENPLTGTVVSFDEYMANKGFTVDPDEYLTYVKKYKLFLMKTDVRSFLPDSDDSISNIIRLFMAKMIWYEEMTDAQKTQIDDSIAILKQTYPLETCISGVNNLVNTASTIETYYNKKNTLMESEDLTVIMNY